MQQQYRVRLPGTFVDVVDPQSAGVQIARGDRVAR